MRWLIFSWTIWFFLLIFVTIHGIDFPKYGKILSNVVPRKFFSATSVQNNEFLLEYKKCLPGDALLLQKLRTKGHSLQRIINFLTVHYKISNERILGTNCMNVRNVITDVNFWLKDITKLKCVNILSFWCTWVQQFIPRIHSSIHSSSFLCWFISKMEGAKWYWSHKIPLVYQTYSIVEKKRKRKNRRKKKRKFFN